MAAPTATTASKSVSQQQQNLNQITSEGVSKDLHKRPLLKSLFSIDSGLQPAALLKERLQNRCFPVKLLRTLFFLSNTSR